MKRNEILRSYGTEYKEMTKRLLERAALAEDIVEKALGLSLSPEDMKIGLKPNLVTPTPASYGATTHPEVTAGVIEYLKEHGLHRISIAEGSWIGDKTSDAFEYCGYHALAREYDIEIIDTKKDGSSKRRTGDLELNVCGCVDSFDYLINIPVIKGHCQTHITCALKNMKGLIPDSEKRRFHTMGLHKPIAYLNTVIHQDFIVVDHICGDLDFEEGGHPVVRNCVMAAKDPVLLDSYVCSLLDYSLEDVPYVKLAEELGAGCADLTKLKLLTLEGDGSADLPPDKKLLSVSYAVDDYDSCSACYASLVPALERLKEEGLLDRLNVPVSIGQGHRGKAGRVGIGNCCSEFDFHVPGCPPKEEEIYRQLKDYIVSDIRSDQ